MSTITRRTVELSPHVATSYSDYYTTGSRPGLVIQKSGQHHLVWPVTHYAVQHNSGEIATQRGLYQVVVKIPDEGSRCKIKNGTVEEEKLNLDGKTVYGPCHDFQFTSSVKCSRPMNDFLCPTQPPISPLDPVLHNLVLQEFKKYLHRILRPGDIKKDLQQRSPSSPTPSCSSASSVSSTHSAESSPTTTPTKNNKTSMYEKVKDPRYKTELCKTFEERGECPYGNYCLYAHGASELRKRERHTKYKTELCWRFHTIGLCPYGDRCTFIHTVSPLKASPPTERLPVKSCERSTSKFEAFLLELAPS